MFSPGRSARIGFIEDSVGSFRRGHIRESTESVPTAFCDPDDPFIALATDTAREVYGQEPFVEPFNDGSGPGYPFLAHLGVSFVSCGVGYDGGMGHAPNENMRLEDWLTGTKHMARILEEFFGV